MIKFLELTLSQEVYEYLEELDEMNWSARGNVLNQYLRNTSIGTTVRSNNKMLMLSKPKTTSMKRTFGYAAAKDWNYNSKNSKST